MSFRFKLCLLVSSLVMSSCGITKKNGSLNEDPKYKDQNVTYKYILENDTCLGDASDAVLGEYNAYIWDGNQTELKNFTDPQANYFSKLGFQSKSIYNAVYDLKQSSSCQIINGRLSCPEKSEVTSEPKSLTICNSKNPPARDSIESVAITSGHHLDKIWSFYQGLSGRKHLRKSTLVVLPSFEKKFYVEENSQLVKKIHTISNNLAYNHSYLGRPAFIIYPTADDQAPKGDAFKANLWESSWTLSHEFGHHVFREHTGVSKIKNLSLRNMLNGDDTLTSGGHFPTNHKTELKNFSLTTNSRVVTVKEQWASINEAFSDLFAFYGNGSQGQMTKNLYCLSENRDVLNANFSDGNLKSLNQGVLNIFFSTESIPSFDCNTPWFQGPHSMGAIIAHGVNAVFEKAVNKSSSEMLLNWADEIGELAKNGTSSLTLEIMIEKAIEVSTSDLNKTQLNQKQCDALNQVFPVYGKTWFESKRFICEG